MFLRELLLTRAVALEKSLQIRSILDLLATRGPRGRIEALSATTTTTTTMSVRPLEDLWGDLLCRGWEFRGRLTYHRRLLAAG
jgi:hypothetical protein